MEWVGSPSVVGPTPRIQYALVTASLFGIQFIWSIQQVFVNIELLSLGLSKAQLSLMWIVSPLCGLLVQPIVGSLSDKSTNKNGRRRPFMVWGAFVCAAALLVFAWAKSLGDIFEIRGFVVAMSAVVVLDVAVNTCQATSRALVVDMFSTEQQKEAMAMASVMVSMGHLFGYGMGQMRWLQLGFDSRLKGVCVVYAAVCLISVAISATSVQELVFVQPIYVQSDADSTRTIVISKTTRFLRALQDLWTNIAHLDSQLKDIFKVQLFAWYGWFTFLYYGSTYAAEVWVGHNDTSISINEDDLTIIGSNAMFVFSSVSTVSAFLLAKFEPHMINTWIASLAVYAVAMLSTRFITQFSSVLIMFGLVGFSWAVTQWVPFALTSRRIHELSQIADSQEDNHGAANTETLRVLNDDERQQEIHENTDKGGIILGIHNSALTLPQFVSTFGSYLIFRFMDLDPQDPHQDGGRAVGATLQVGALTAFLAAAYAYRLKSVEKARANID